ncbi:hypothetical protein ACFSJQ_22030 [Vibrio olivae]
MSTKQLTINDKLHAVVTDRQAINVSWQVDFTQYRYEVNIYHQGKALYFKSKFGNENTHCVEGLTLKPSCQYHVEVVVYGDAESFRVYKLVYDWKFWQIPRAVDFKRSYSQ